MLLLLLGCAPEPPPPAADTGGACPYAAEPDWSDCLVTLSTDLAGDGLPPDRERRGYDERGLLVAYDLVSGSDPADVLVCARGWLDADRPTSWRCGGSQTFLYTWTYDEDGALVSGTYDRGADGSPDRRWSYVTDEEGHVVEQTTDEDLDGVPDARATWTWRDGVPVREAWDYDADGVEDWARETDWTRYPAGPLEAERRTDSDADGAVDEVTTWTRDAAGNPLLVRTESAGAGAEDRYTWRDCFLASVEHREDGGAVTWTRYDRDAEGRAWRVREDLDDDGHTDRTTDIAWTCEAP